MQHSDPQRYKALRIVFALLIAFSGIIMLSHAVSSPAEAQIFARPYASGGNCLLEFNVECNTDSIQVGETQDINDTSDFGLSNTKILPRVITAIVCRVEKLVGIVFADVWCKISEAMEGPLTIILIIYVMIFGISFAVGAIPATTGEVVSRIMKLMLVWAFITQPEFGLELAFNFFMFLLQDGISIVLSDPPTQYPGEPTSYGILSRIDQLLGGIFNLNQNDMMGRVISVYAGLQVMALFPGGQILGMLLIGSALLTFFVMIRTVLTYLVALIGIVFLLTLGPIFICFALFQQTSTIFEQWLSQLISFALQPIIIFAYLMLAHTYMAEVWKEFFQTHQLLSFMMIDDYGANNMTSNMTTIIGEAIGFISNACESQDASLCSQSLNALYTQLYNNGFIAEILKGFGALMLLNFATVVFLNLVPSLARELVKMGRRTIQIGGAWMGGRNVTASGTNLALPGEGSYSAAMDAALGYLGAPGTRPEPGEVPRRPLFWYDNGRETATVPGIINAMLAGAGKSLTGDAEPKYGPKDLH